MLRGVPREGCQSLPREPTRPQAFVCTTTGGITVLPCCTAGPVCSLPGVEGPGARTGCLSSPPRPSMTARSSWRTRGRLNFCLGSPSPSRAGLRGRIPQVSGDGPRRVPVRPRESGLGHSPCPWTRRLVPKKNPVSADPAPAVCSAEPHGPGEDRDGVASVWRSSPVREGATELWARADGEEPGAPVLPPPVTHPLVPASVSPSMTRSGEDSRRTPAQKDFGEQWCYVPVRRPYAQRAGSGAAGTRGARRI